MDMLLYISIIFISMIPNTIKISDSTKPKIPDFMLSSVFNTFLFTFYDISSLLHLLMFLKPS